MQAFEVGMIVSQHGTSIDAGIGEDLNIIDTLIGSARFLNRDYIVSKTAQLLDHRKREILIRIQSGHVG